MANQPEISNFDAGVYQWETSDPVLGGAGGLANVPLLSLSNRTRYLKDQVTSLLTAIALLAPNNSPTLTGTPRSVTPPASAASTEIVTAALLRLVTGGVSYVQIQGDTALTAVQTGPGVIDVYGATTATANIIFPATQGRWTVHNGTPNHIVCRTSTGTTSVTIASTFDKTIWSDGTNMLSADSDYENVALAGIPTTPTPPDGDNSAQIPNTFWIGRALAEFSASKNPGGVNGNGAYLVHPSGVIIQGGNGVTYGGDGDLFAFPISFPNAMLAGVAGEGNAAPGWFSGYPSPSPTVLGMQGFDRGSFKVSSLRIPPGGGGAALVSGISFSWLAIGY